MQTNTTGENNCGHSDAGPWAQIKVIEMESAQSTWSQISPILRDASS